MEKPQEDRTKAEHLITECIKKRAPTLSLTGLGLRALPESLRALNWLETLEIGQNNITHLPEWIGELTQLRFLGIREDGLQAFPASIIRLERLDTLLIIGVLPSLAQEELGRLSSLKRLALVGSKLTEVPSWIRGLRNLETLVLFSNRITTLPDWIGELQNLETLDLKNNHLTTIPLSLLESYSLNILRLEKNQALSIPVEILKTGNSRRILSYYFRTSIPGTSKPLNEFKLILVGRGGVGKTTLVHRLITDRYKEFKRTPGIKITQWETRIGDDAVRAHIWDFGGQEIMHGTHRFFMTERALYLVLISGREDTVDRDAEYWLSMVRSFAGDVPIIVLLHKWSDYHFELNRKLLREKYGQNLVFAETDSSTGHGIDALREHLRELATSLPGLRAAWPSAWRFVKEELPQKKKSWMTFDDFLAFCVDWGIADSKDQESLAESLHDLGLMLSYRADETLRDFGVLNPQWVTKGIYEMLNSPVLRDANGRFTIHAFEQVLPAKTYPKELHRFLLALMRKFRLCHPLDEKGEKYLIPELLTKEEPNLDAQFQPDKCLGFIYRYDSVLPEGLLPRFIVETYVHREPKHAWRTGVVLERANCRALVRGDVQGRAITVRVDGIGNGRREMLGIIREHFERIHKSYEKLPVTEYVPIPGFPDAVVKHELLLKYERTERAKIAVEIGDELRDFSVKELLDGVDLPGAPRAKLIDVGKLRLPDYDQILGRDSLPVFISYARKDWRFLDQLRAALVPYERKGELEVQADELVAPGQTWEDEILTRLSWARIVILLLSNDFIRSSYCMEQELPRVMERRDAGECEVVPVVIRPCRYDKLELGKIQAIQPDDKPISAHKNKDSAWLEVTKQLDRVIAPQKRR
ncbi:TIR domain-containing protein [Pyxidicoccus parkwayensis]|uniref:non-specific serine/threonine protein kinase n=1 Tax=Pyxidicoccus parkwayensis TaxID=2813578 RepID=A0ABX7P0P1_9BACT|nr:COR domain-containing protein [Pyxidicoccus parkwaysis]QSQ23236.1 TIR domain-containing protein [Pyxidicoccus parkwaysis]